MNRARVWAVAAALAVATPASAGAQETRAGIAAEQRVARSRELRPAEPGTVERTFLKFSDERVLDRLFNPRKGLFVRVGLPTEGAAFGGGPGWRASDNARRYTFTASAVGSISREWLGEVALHVPDLFPRWSQDRFFADISASRSGRVENEFWGLGNDSPSEARSIFRLAQTAVGGTLGVRVAPWLSVSAGASRFAPDVNRSSTRQTSTVDTFDETTAPGVVTQPAFLRSQLGVDLDYRDSTPPTRTARRLDTLPLAGASHGGRYQATLASYRDREFDRYTFTRTRIDLQQFIPLLHGHRVLAFRALAIFSDSSGANVVPFYLAPTYGGLNVGRGYPTFRFRDRNMLALQAEYRYQVSPLISGALFADSGQVASKVGDLQWSAFKTTYGFGVRFGAADAAALRFDLAFGGDRATFILGLGHAF